MKLCKDCVHCNFADHNLSECNAPGTKKISLVTGQELSKKYTFCSALRSTGDTEICGEEGKWFEPLHDALRSAHDALDENRKAASMSVYDALYKKINTNIPRY